MQSQMNRRVKKNDNPQKKKKNQKKKEKLCAFDYNVKTNP